MVRSIIAVPRIRHLVIALICLRIELAKHAYAGLIGDSRCLIAHVALVARIHGEQQVVLGEPVGGERTRDVSAGVISRVTQYGRGT